MAGRTSQEDEEIAKEAVDKLVEWYTAGDGPEVIGQAIRDFEHYAPFPYPGRYRFEEKITGYCAICNEKLSNEFPEDFPNEFKFCCACLGWAEILVCTKDADGLGNALSSHESLKKVFNRITFVIGNGKRKK